MDSSLRIDREVMPSDYGMPPYLFAENLAGGTGGPNLSGSGDEEYRPLIPKVLVVDDERLLADTTARILRGAGFDVKTAYNGWDALDLVGTFHPDILLTDVMMPLMNGFELAVAVSRMRPSTRVLLISGQAGITHILDQGRAEGYEFPLLAKPAHPLKVIETLKALQTNRR